MTKAAIETARSMITPVEKAKGGGYSFVAALSHDTVREFHFNLKRDAEAEANSIFGDMVRTIIEDGRSFKQVSKTIDRSFVNNTIIARLRG